MKPTQEGVAPEVGSSRKSWTVLDVVLLLVAVIASGLVEWTHIDPVPSFDELWHLAMSTGRGTPVGYFPPDQLLPNLEPITSIAGAPPIWNVWFGLDGIPHPPLYFVALRAWRMVIGESDFAAYLFSIACQLVGVAFVFCAARLTMSRWVGLFAGLTLGCAQTQTYFAQEVRPYSLAIALVAAALYLMARVDRCGPTKWAVRWLAILPLLLMLTHYFNAGIALAIVLFGLVRFKEDRKLFVRWLCVAAGVFSVAWLPLMVRQMLHPGPAGDFLRVDRLDLPLEIGLFFCSPFRLIADRTYLMQSSTLVSGVVFFLPWFLYRRFGTLVWWTACLCGAVVPILLLDLLGSREHLTVVRYLASASPAVILVMVGSTWAIRPALGHLIATTLCFTGVIYLVSRNPIGMECSNFQDGIREIEKRTSPGDVLLAYHGTQPPFLADIFLLTCAHSEQLTSHPAIRMTRPMREDEAGRLPRRVWLIAGLLDQPVNELIPGARVQHKNMIDFNAELYELTFDRDIQESTGQSDLRPQGDVPAPSTSPQ